MGQYFLYIDKEGGITNDVSLLFYIITLMSFLLIPKAMAGIIRGLTILFDPDDFHKKIIDKYPKETTEIHFSKKKPLMLMI
jgi:hypothetical protein